MIAALDADVDRQLADAAMASAAISTRAAILVAAAGLTSGLQVTVLSIWPAAMTALSALIGVWLLMMRTSRELPIAEAEERFWNDPPVTARRNVMRWKLSTVLMPREKALKRKRTALVAGFALLAASICLELALNLVAVACGGG